MKRFFCYLRLQYKKSAALTTKILINTVLVIASAVLVFFAASRIFLNSRTFEKARIAIVTQDTDLRTTLAIGLVGEMESVKNICEFLICSEEDANQGLYDGTVEAAIFLTPHIYDDINEGYNTPVTVKFAKNSLFAGDLFKGLIEDGERIVRIVESACYAGGDAYEIYEVNGSRAWIEGTIFDIYVAKALSRNALYKENVLEPRNGFSIYHFYFAAILTACALITGISLGVFYQKNDRAVAWKLNSVGLNPAVTGLCRILVIATLLCFILMILSVLTACAGPFASSAIVKMMTDQADSSAAVPLSGLAAMLQSFSFTRLLHVFIWLILPLLSMGAFFHMVYSFADDEVSGSRYSLLAVLVLVILGGLLVPGSYLPDAFRTISRFLPAVWWVEGIENAAFGTLTLSGLLPSLVIFVICFLAAQIAERRQMA